ncbi:MAG: hypothetical protein ACRC7N_21235 [Clostridium sp.]
MDSNEVANIVKEIKSLDLNSIQLPKYEFPDLNFINTNYNFDELNKSVREKYQREVENNENLKSIVNYNEKISTYNRELVSLNEKILNKINSLDDTLIFLNQSFTNKVENDKESEIRNQALLLELITIIDSKDSSRLEKFMTTLGAPVAAGLIVEYFKFKLGLS